MTSRTLSRLAKPALSAVTSFRARTASAAWRAISRAVIVLPRSLASSPSAPGLLRASAADSASSAEP